LVCSSDESKRKSYDRQTKKFEALCYIGASH
jgi:hypothetical protein